MFPFKATYCSIDYRVIFKIVLKVHQRKVEKSDETTSVRIKRFLEAKLVNCSAAWPLYRCHVLRRDWRLCFIFIFVRFIDCWIMDMLNFRISKTTSIWRESNATKYNVSDNWFYVLCKAHIAYYVKKFEIYYYLTKKYRYYSIKHELLVVLLVVSNMRWK